MIFYTSICSNYLPKAMALAESVKRHCKEARFVLCLVEREIPKVALDYPHFDEVILAKDAGWDNFNSFMFRHSIVEASTAVKPRFMIHLLERYPENKKFVYLDPDVLVYSDLVELEEILDTESIVLAPHLLRPGNVDMEISSLAHGTYNLGFLAIHRHENAERFLQWWADRLFLYCYDDKSRGIFTDQKWIDLVPSFFDAYILKHHGYDFATWSLLGSDLREENGQYIVNGDPLRFIHFSGLDSKTIDKAIEWWLTPDNRGTFVRLYEEYKAALNRHGQELLGRLPWTYATYADGTPIGKEARISYRAAELWAKFPEPFMASDRSICAESTNQKRKQDAAAGAGNASLLKRVHRSTKEVGVTATIVKVFQRMARR
jgi:hypothetical protein